MKKIITFFFIALSLSAQSQIKSATLQASGLTCAMCSKAIYKALVAIPFIDKVQPDIERSMYAITFKNNAAVDPDALGKAVVNAGFSVSMLKITANFDNAKIQNDAHVRINDKVFHFLNVPAQTLNGTKTITLVDRSFISVKDFKKYSKLTSMKCYETGMMAACCAPPAAEKKTSTAERVYHVTI